MERGGDRCSVYHSQVVIFASKENVNNKWHDEMANPIFILFKVTKSFCSERAKSEMIRGVGMIDNADSICLNFFVGASFFYLFVIKKHNKDFALKYDTKLNL